MEDKQEVTDILDSMINGTYEVPSSEEIEQLDEEVTQQEDTDQQEETEEEELSANTNDGESEQGSDDEVDDEGEDTLVDDGSSEEETEKDVEADVAEDTDTVDDKDSTDTEEDNDGDDSETTETIDYKLQYEELLDKSKVAQTFYDKVTNAEFKVNGKMVKGFTDPDKIIQSQQMSGGLAKKLADTKQFKPYIKLLKERGMLEDPEKFNLAFNLLDGDPEALKHHMKTLGIDPVMDLDMEAIKYDNKSVLASKTQLALDDALEQADANGVGEQFSRVIASDWDQSSFDTIMENRGARETLISQLGDGTYEKVQERINELESVDVNGTFGAMNSVTKYHNALMQLQNEQRQVTETADTEAHAVTQEKADEASKATKIKAEKAKITKARQEEKYKSEIDKKNKAVAAKRRKATAASKNKAKATITKKDSPLNLNGADFSSYLDSMIAKS